MRRNPNDPIPGFEEEFTGTVGTEKRIHKTHFQGVEKTWESDNDNWEEVRPGHWVRRTQKPKEDRSSI